MNTVKSLFFAFVALLAVLLSCQDDLGIEAGRYAEGEAQLSVEVSFDQEQVSLSTRASGGDRGDLIQDMNPLYMVVYKEDGNLYDIYPVWGDGITAHQDISGVEHELADNRLEQEKAPDGGLQDTQTGKVTYTMKLKSGKYYIYAVANVADLPMLDISTRDKLKALEFVWDEKTTSNNSQMFGIFTENPDRSAKDDVPLVVSAGIAKLHCWARRLASKVTVAFDGSGLYDNVQIFITDIAVKDIPRKCALGLRNTPGKGLDGNSVEVRRNRHDAGKYPNGVIEKGKHIHIQSLPGDVSDIQPDKYLHVCNVQHPYLGIGNDGGSIEKAHAHNSASLFFYENIQGQGKSKKQSQNGITIDYPNDSIDIVNSGWKDEKPFGTYVEVKGYYRCISQNNQMGSGSITFRYMLGQKSEQDTSYSALRNTHYKLTLKFKGYGNDADWHIDYEEKPGIYVTSPQYISYLYNKMMMSSVKIVGKMKEGSKLKVQILETKTQEDTYWRPWGDGTEAFPLPEDESKNKIYWNNDVAEKIVHSAVEDDGPWNSFLSLKQSRVITIKDLDSNDKDAASGVAYIHKYYNKHGEGNRDYEIVPGTYDNDDGSTYRVTASSNGMEHIFYIPLFTRPKVLCTRTGYVGNNPFVAYPRRARLKITAEIWNEDKKDFETQETQLEIIQVRRIINPKGIWRKAGSRNTFHVELLHLPEDNDTASFVSFKSQGGWSAEIVSGGDNIILLSSVPEGSGVGNTPQKWVRRIEGLSEHPVKFDINFLGEETGHAVVRVRYHNYTCEHDIFCSVGDKPVKLRSSSKPDKPDLWWHTRNVYCFDAAGVPVYTKSPMEAGSLFRRGNNTAILDKNDRDRYGFAVDPKGGNFMVLKEGGTTESDATWDGCKPIIEKFGTWSIPSNPYGEHIATGEDCYTLIPEVGEEDTFEIKQAYGILYGDGASGPQKEQASAYRVWSDRDEIDTDHGMRGCFVYNKNNGKHIFLPIGALGYGHRKHSGGWRNYDNPGTLRYAGRSDRFDVYNRADLKYQPLFYDLYRRPGAIYWCGTRVPGGTAKSSCAFDINFFTMSFNGYGNDAATDDGGADSHACFIRTVYTSEPKYTRLGY